MPVPDCPAAVAARYQTARELVHDLENCKDGGKKAVANPRKAAPAAKAVVSAADRAAAASKFVASAPKSSEPESSHSVAPLPEIQTFSQAHEQATERKSWAAAASVGHSSAPDSGSRWIEEPAQLSATAFETEAETPNPRIAVDPVMAGAAQNSSGQSFSDIAELPPLKEVSSLHDQFAGCFAVT